MEDKKQNEPKMPKVAVLMAYIKGHASTIEKAIVDEWLNESEKNEATLMKVARIYFAYNTKERIESRDSYSAYKKIKQRIRKRKYRLWLGRTAAVAACITGLLFLSTFFAQRMNTTYYNEPQIVTMHSNIGVRTHFNLPDGSIVYLNAGSTISYPIPFPKDKRPVSLSGEAYFNVTENANSPFIVSTFNDRMFIKVTGTEFNVEAYEDDYLAHTTLVNGEVSVLFDKEGVVSEYPLSPSQKGTFDLITNIFRVQTVNSEIETGWISGKVIFKDTPLPEVLRKLSHFYDVEFEVKDKVIDTYFFTGTFENRHLQRVLEYLKTSSGIEYTFIPIYKDDLEETVRQKIILQKSK